MTFEEVRAALTEDLESIYTVTLIDRETLIGVIDGPYRGYDNSPQNYRKVDYFFVATLQSGLATSVPVTCESAVSIAVR